MLTEAPTVMNGDPVLVGFDFAIDCAFRQNAIPVFKELRLQNDPTARKDLTIRITTEPPFSDPTEVRIQGVDASARSHVAPLNLKLIHDLPRGLRSVRSCGAADKFTASDRNAGMNKFMQCSASAE